MSSDDLLKIRSLKLDRPLAVFDLESTGIAVQYDRIVSICVAKIMPDGGMDVKSRLVNPQVPIPAESTEIHGITDDDVADQPSFRLLARSLSDYFDGCDLAGFNIIYFDIPLLLSEFDRAQLPFDMRGRRVLDAFQVFRRREPRTLTAAMRHYCNAELEDAHNCEADVLATIKVLEAQLHRYEDLPKSIVELDAQFNPRTNSFVDWDGKLRWEKDRVVIGFGQKRGTALNLLVEEDPSYLEWILGGDFSAEVKTIVANALKGEYPDPPGGGKTEPEAAPEQLPPPHP